MTKASRDGLEFVKKFDIDNYCALVTVGGDGTIYEVINGLMTRPDKKKIPLAFLPNGTGNDTCFGFAISTFQEGLNALIKGNIINIDVNKVTLDSEIV